VWGKSTIKSYKPPIWGWGVGGKKLRLKKIIKVKFHVQKAGNSDSVNPDDT
jgi:hypothetical protein